MRRLLLLLGPCAGRSRSMRPLRLARGCTGPGSRVVVVGLLCLLGRHAADALLLDDVVAARLRQVWGEDHLRATQRRQWLRLAPPVLPPQRLRNRLPHLQKELIPVMWYFDV